MSWSRLELGGGWRPRCWGVDWGEPWRPRGYQGATDWADMRDSGDALESAPCQSGQGDAHPATLIAVDRTSPDTLVATPQEVDDVAFESDLSPTGEIPVAAEVAAVGRD